MTGWESILSRHTQVTTSDKKEAPPDLLQGSSDKLTHALCVRHRILHANALRLCVSVALIWAVDRSILYDCYNIDAINLYIIA